MSRARKQNRGNPAKLQTVSTGITVEASRFHHNPNMPPPKPGEHQWMVLAMWRVDRPDGERFDLDTENLMTIEGPGCFVCEQPYSPEMAAEPCPGEPS